MQKGTLTRFYLKIIKSIQKMASIHIVVILSISALLDISWFREGLVIAYAESGLLVYNNKQWFYMFSHLWLDQASTGTSSLVSGACGLPLHVFLGFLEILGFTPVQKEAIAFYLLLSLSGLSMYYLVLVAFGLHLHRDSIALLASIFYMLNPYAMVLIWNRFLPDIIVAYAFIPLALALYMEGLCKKRYVYVLYTAFVLTFSMWHVSLPVLVPFLLLTYLIFHLIVNHERRELTYAMKFSILLAAVWVVLNLWLLLPLTYNLYGQWWGFSTPSYARYFLTGYPMQDVIKLNFYFASNAVIWPFYKSITGKILGAVIPIVVFSALIVTHLVTFEKADGRFNITLTFRKNDRTLYFAFLAILGIFLGSVATTPLREAIVTLLNKIPYPLSPLISNNLFGEKAIELSAIGYSVLFGVTLSGIYFKAISSSKLAKIRAKRIIGVILLGSIVFVTCVAYVWPMWTGYVFTQPYIPAEEKLGYIKVPEYYSDAATWLSSQIDYFRILSLPFVEGGITYTWKPYGYSGSTTDFVLLPKPVIMESRGSMSNDLIEAISQLMDTGYINDVWKVLSLLNVKYIMVHEDINYTDRHTKNPKDIEQQLSFALTPYLNVQNITNPDGDPITLSLKGWQTVWGTAPVQISLGSNGSPYVEYTGFTSTDYGYFAFAYLAENSLDISNATWIDISLMSTLPGKMLIAIRDDSNNEMFFDGRYSTFYTIKPDEVNRWLNLTLPLGSPTYTTAQKPDLSHVRYILIGLVDMPKNIPVTLKVKNVMLDKGAKVPIQGISFERRFGELVFYKVNSNLERIYVANNPVIVNDPSEVINIIKSKPHVQSNEAFIDSNVGEITTVKNMDNKTFSTPNMTFKKINPTKWVIQVQNATDPFIAVFNEAYNPQWKAYYGEINWMQAFYSEPLPEKYHFMANGYANAWYVNKTGTYTITLYFWPQNYFYLGATISGTTLAVSIVFILCKPLKFLLFKRKRTEYKGSDTKLN